MLPASQRFDAASRRDEKSKVQSATEGELPHLRWRIADDAELRNDLICRSRGDEAQTKDQSETPSASAELRRDEHVVSYKNPIELDDATKQRLRDMLTWEYGFGAATKRKAKQPVTALSRTATDELDEESAPIFVERKFSRLPQRSARGKISAAATGTAHHKFLQYFSFESAASLASLAAEAKRLEQEKVLSVNERAALNLENVAAFWNSALGQKIRRQPPEFVKRELSLTVKFSIAELDDILGEISGANLENEFVVVQGRVDLAVLSPKEIWLVDFKTDNVNEDDFSKKEQDYKKQLKLYAQALEKIYLRPVTNCWLHFLSAQKTVSVEI